MAQKVSVLLVDDIDGSEASETVSLGLDGTRYEIELNSEHAQELRGQLEAARARLEQELGQPFLATERKRSA